MNTSQLLSHHDHLCEEARNLMVKKNADYAEAEAPFKNFELSERLGLCSTEAGMAIRLSDKIQRLCGFLAGKDLKVKDESVRDTILDAVNYLVLISARLEENKSADDYAKRMNETASDPVEDHWKKLVKDFAEAVDGKILSCTLTPQQPTHFLDSWESKVRPVTSEEVRERCGQCRVIGGTCAYGSATAPWACMGTKVSCP